MLIVTTVVTPARFTEVIHGPCRRDTCAQARAKRRYPGPQLPGGRCAGRSRFCRRFPWAIPASRQDGSGCHRILWRAFHGRDGRRALSGEACADPRPRSRVLPCRFHRRRPASFVEGRAPGCSRRLLRQYDRRVKAESDYCCTSANAVQIVGSLPESREILFLPDMFLGNHVRKVTGRKNIHVWWGECHVHAAVKPIAITSARHEHPSADFMVHPECGCTTPAMYLASEGDQSMEHAHILSTGGMMRRARVRGVRVRRSHRDRHPPRAQEAEPGEVVLSRRRVHGLPFHEDDYAREPAGLPAARPVRGQRASAHSRAGKASHLAYDSDDGLIPVIPKEAPCRYSWITRSCLLTTR